MSKFSSILEKNLHFLIVAFILVVPLFFLKYKTVNLSNQIVILPSLASSCEVIFSRNLRYGNTGNDVAKLQKILNLSDESGHFDLLTYHAVIKFQEKYATDILLPLGLTVGTGFVGPYTRAKIEKEMCLISLAGVVEDIPTNSNKLFNFWYVLVVLILVWGVNFIFWGSIGVARLLTEKINALIFGKNRNGLKEHQIEEEEVAVIVPAHNEELVIADTLKSLLNITKPTNIFVVSDGSSDSTAQIAHQYGVSVLELNPNRGKAGAIETSILRFKISQKYKAVVLIDADTRLKNDYLKKALPFFDDPEVVAIAGFASTIWQREKLSWRQMLFVLHRDRIYFLFQMLIKFGQTWKYANVTHIVPGFASIYRTSILNQIDINPSGLVIEDFNMTFEVHRKKLGKIAHHPSVVAYTQDPDNLKDYYRQIKRWHLGFWQTIRLHGFWPSKFWLSMAITLMEVVLGNLTFLLMPLLILTYFVLDSSFFLTVFFITWAVDYLLTIIVALFQKRWEYLIVGLTFPLLRFVDAVALLLAIPRAFLVRSDGRWISPSRRAEGSLGQIST